MKTKCIITFGLLILGWNTGVTQINLDSGLIAKYYFNGNANDESGNGNNGVVHGAALTTDRFGNEKHAYSFTSINNYIDITTALGKYFDSTITVSGWVNKSIGAAPLVIGNNQFLFNWQEYFVFVLEAGNRLYYSKNELKNIFNQWHLISATFNGDSVKLYFE